MRLSLLSVSRVWDTSQQAFCGAKYGKGYSFPMLAMKVLSLVTYYNGTPHFANENKEKSSAIF